MKLTPPSLGSTEGATAVLVIGAILALCVIGKSLPRIPV